MSHAARQRALYVPTRKKRSSDTKWNGSRGTPQEFYDWIEQLMPFTVDVCADETNAKHPRHFDEYANGLAQSWAGETYFCNPPYGRRIGDWLRKGRDACIYEQALGCFLIPARVDTAWWRSLVMQVDENEFQSDAGSLMRSFYDPLARVHFYRWERLITAVYFHDERIKFEGEGLSDGEDIHGAPFPSALVFMGSTSRARPASTFAGPADRNLLARWPR